MLTDLTTLDGYRTMFYRLLGNDILGMLEDSYVGLNSWLEDPAFYCGLFTVFAVPLGIAAMDKRKRRWYMIPFAGVVAYNMFGFIRYCANGFGGAGWKLSSLWIIVVLLITAAVFWQQEVQMEKKILRRLLAGTNVVIVVLSLLFWKEGIQIPSFICQLLMGILLSVLLYCALTKEGGKKDYYRYLLVMGAAIEIICASWPVVNNKAVITGEALNEQVYYNDATMELLQPVKAENAFERVDKQYASVFYCDSFYQDYKGIASYIGGVGDNDYTGQLYQLWGLPTLSHVQKGAGQSTVIDTLLNVHYVMLKHQEVNTYGLTSLAEKDGITLYENEYALPFGYTYDTYIKESDFMDFMPLDRRNLMMDRCVVADDDAAKAAAFMKEDGAYDILADKWAEYQRPFTVEEGHDVRFEQIQPGEIAVLALKVQGQEMLWAEGYYRQGSRIRSRFDTRIMPGEEEQYIECMLEGVDNISIQASAALPYEITEVSLYVIPQEEYFGDYRTQSEERSRSHFNISAFQEERIEGNTRMEEKGLMVFTIPYDKRWTAYVDGEESNLLRVNTAFQGLLLEKGDHEIVLEYKAADYWWIIGLLTLAGYVIIIGLLTIREKKAND